MLVNRIHFPLLFLLAFSAGWSADEEDLAFLQASVALDRVMIPALVSMREGDFGEAGGHLERIGNAWEIYQSTQGGTLEKAPGWTLIREGIDRRLQMAKRFEESNDASMVRPLLAQIRSDLVRMRQSLDKETFIDRLVGFQAGMEAVLGRSEAAVEQGDPAAVRSGIEALRDSWQKIGKIEINNQVYGLLWKDASDLKDLVRKESNLLDELLTAVDRSDGDEVRRLAAEAGTAFLDVYLFFADQPAGS